MATQEEEMTQLALRRLGPKGYQSPQQAHLAALPLAGTPGTPQQHRPKLFLLAVFPSCNQQQLDDKTTTLLLLSQLFCSMIL